MKGALEFPVGRLFGVTIRVHLVFVLVLAWIAYATHEAGGSEGALWAAARVGVVVFSVLVHELGHSLATRALGGVVHDILLWPLGGVTRIRRLPESPLSQALVSISGPAANGVCALLLLPLALADGAPLPRDPTALFAAPLPVLAFLLNAAMALVNLVPAHPLDGGLLVRALLSGRIGERRALRAVVWPARLIGLASVPLVLSDDGWFPVALVGVFVWWMAEREARLRPGEAVDRRVPPTREETS